MDPQAIEKVQRPGTPAGFGCPECGGSLYTLSTGDVIHFRCRVGHAWSQDTLLAEQGTQLETALWTALRALEESASLRLQVAERLRRRGNQSSAERLEQRAASGLRDAELIRSVLTQGTVSDAVEEKPPAMPGARQMADAGREEAGGR
jgi:two-component system chemotaxis response regulator CheB